MLKIAKKLLVIILKKMELGSAISVRLTYYSGKSKTPVHPKHFLYKNPWFTEFLKKNDIALDLGSGNGQNAIKCSKFCKKIVGLELDDNLIKIASKSAANLKIKNVSFKKANLESKLPLKDSSFSKVIFIDVLEHLYKRDQILKEIKRILKPGGMVLISVPNKETSWKKLQRSAGVCSFSDPDHKVEFSEKSITNLLKKHRFKIRSITYSSYDNPYRGLVDILGGISIPLYKKISKWRLEKAQENPKEAQGFEIAASRI